MKNYKIILDHVSIYNALYEVIKIPEKFFFEFFHSKPLKHKLHYGSYL